MQNKLEKIYTNPADPGSFGGIERLLRSAKSRGLKVNRKTIVNYLKGVDSYTLHKPARRHFLRNPIVTGGIDKQWQADLVDMSVEKTSNEGNRYILTCIDCFSKFAWAIPLKTKEGPEVKGAFERIMVKRKPQKIQTDKGLEFLNKFVQKHFKQNNIQHFVTQNETKAAIVERFNRTLKTRMWTYFTANNTRRYVDVLQKLIDSYNQSIHRTIGMKPADVRPEHEQRLFRRMFGSNPVIVSVSKTLKTKKNIKHVRISKTKGNFEKGYLPNWTGEIFKVKSVEQRRPKSLYKLSDLNNEDILGSFYPEEVQSVKYDPNKLYPVEKILKTRTIRGRKENFVKWLNWPEKFNSWIVATEIKSLD